MQKYEILKFQILEEMDEILKNIVNECVSMPRNRTYLSEGNLDDYVFQLVDKKVRS